MICLSRIQSLEVKNLLTITLFVLVAVLQAQDDLPFLSEDKNVRQGEMVDRSRWKALILSSA